MGTVVRNLIATICMTAIVLSAAMVFSGANELFTQGGAQVITHISGVQYEGNTFPVPAVFSAPNVNAATPIQVIDDGLRRIFVNRDSIAGIGDSNRSESEFDIPQKTYVGNTKGFGNLQFAGSFDEFGHRHIRVFDGRITHNIVQGITKVTPRWCQLETLANPEAKKLRTYSMRVATSSVPRDVVKALLRSSVESGNIESHLEVVEFYIQAEQFQDAMRELELIQRLYPQQVDRIRDNRRVIRQVHARQYLQLIESRIDLGQPLFASQMIDVFGTDGIAPDILVEMAELKDRIAADDTKVVQVKELVQKKAMAAKSDAALKPNQKAMLDAFQATIDANLGNSTIDRLSTFVRLSNDAQSSDLQKISLAISGWYLGSNGAIDNFAVSEGLPKVHELVKEYLSTEDRNRRESILEELKEYEAGQTSFLAKIVAQIKPPLAPPADKIVYDKPLEFSFDIPGSKADGRPLTFKYQVHLPPEYDPYRKYPCFVTLPTDKNLDRYNQQWVGQYRENLGVKIGQASNQGYIIVTVDWKLPWQSGYSYTAREHLAVLTAYRHALRRFSIDSDRVILAGTGVGAEAAYDIAVSHPDHWAGVVGISGKLDRYVWLYQENRHFRLPVYSVVGEKDVTVKGNLDKQSLAGAKSSRVWTKWLSSKKYNECTVVEYRGRLDEPLTEEIVGIFEWANAQRRKLPDKSGIDIQCKIRRPWDNYFWCIEFLGMPEKNTLFPQQWRDKKLPKPVTVSLLQKVQQPNLFYVGPPKLGDGMILWLSPDYVDFAEKVRIDGRGRFNDYVKPSNDVLLEDVRRRGDRKHPFWAKVECAGTRWNAKTK